MRSVWKPLCLAMRLTVVTECIPKKVLEVPLHLFFFLLLLLDIRWVSISQISLPIRALYQNTNWFQVIKRISRPFLRTILWMFIFIFYYNHFTWWDQTVYFQVFTSGDFFSLKKKKHHFESLWRWTEFLMVFELRICWLTKDLYGYGNSKNWGHWPMTTWIKKNHFVVSICIKIIIESLLWVAKLGAAG